MTAADPSGPAWCPRLRQDLDVFRQVVDGREAFGIRDPPRWTEDFVLVSPRVLGWVRTFDGRCSLRDLATRLSSRGAATHMSELARVASRLDTAGLLDSAGFERRRGRHAAAFAAAVREPFHAGRLYTSQSAALRRMLDSIIEAPSMVTFAGAVVG